MTTIPSPPPFEILAAVDLRGGRVVRLREGDFARETVYEADPVEAARALVERGAPWLHVVDLDAARTGARHHAAQIGAILEAVGGQASVEVGGGIRDGASAARLLAAGARRVVLGSAALRDPGLISLVVREHGADSVAVALDIRDGVAMSDGWTAPTNDRLEVLMVRLVDAGATTFEVTAIDRDGSMGGPNLPLLQRCVDLGDARIIASGGIRDVADVVRVKDAGCVGAIVGRTLYEGVFDLAEAIRLTS